MKREARRTYREKLKDWRWREFSEAVLAYPLFQSHDPAVPVCQFCGRESNLVVHHLGYKPHRDPWDYGFDEVTVLCGPCHSEIHDFADRLWNEILSCRSMDVVHECAKAARMTRERHGH